MARVIAIFNQKGGVGKTTTAMNLSAYLAMMGRKTLLIDFDPQYNATVGLGVRHAPDETIYHILLAGQAPERVIKETYLANLQMIPASPDLAGALVELVNLPDREWYLRNFIERLRNNYEFILIDLGPSLNLLTVNGLASADEILVPIQCEYYSLEGLSQLLETVDLIKNNLGHEIKSVSALLTMYDKRERLSREIAREVRRRFPYKVYEVEIPRSVALAEAPSFQKPIMLYAPQSPGAIAYERLANELVSGVAPETQNAPVYPQFNPQSSFDTES
ncbi:MAG: ParA family protein [Minisyncoccia bacterium]|jgi:chromosome partitioning protein